MVNFAAAERRALATLLAQSGPDAPTLCDGWETKELALHLVERDSRPDLLVGQFLKRVPFIRAHVEKGHEALASEPWKKTVERVAHPGGFSPARLSVTDKMVNTVEFFVHHEDVRRAQPDWQPRALSFDHEATLWKSLKPFTKGLLGRRSESIVLVASGHGSVTAGRGRNGEITIVRGRPSELLLWVFGREAQSNVEVHRES